MGLRVMSVRMMMIIIMKVRKGKENVLEGRKKLKQRKTRKEGFRRFRIEDEESTQSDSDSSWVHFALAHWAIWYPQYGRYADDSTDSCLCTSPDGKQP